MSVLFKVEGQAVIPTVETLAIEPFSSIWERDKEKGKPQAMFEFKYIEFMMSVKKSNPFCGYPEDKRHIAILDNQNVQTDWQPDELVKKGMQWYEEFQEEASLTYNYYKSVRAAAEKMQDFFNTFDMNDVNIKTGNPVYKPRDITSALKDTEDVLTKLDSIKKKVEEELFETSRKKGDKEISPFAQRKK